MSETDFLHPPLPDFVQFETGTACQAHCSICPHDSMKRSGSAKWSLLNKVNRELLPSAKGCCPFLMQEPFAEPRLIPILANIKHRNPSIEVTLYSNMGLVTEDHIHQIIDYELLDNLAVSFYAPTRELHQKYQAGVDYDKAKQAIISFIKYRKLKGKTKPRILMQYIDIPDLMEKLPLFKEEWGKIADSINLVNFDTFHGAIPRLSDNTHINNPELQRTPCQRLWNGIDIHFDGSVVPCCIDYNDEHVLGNLTDQSPMEIWHGQKFTEFRQKHLDGKWDEIPMCKDCDVWKYQHTPSWMIYWLQRGFGR